MSNLNSIVYLLALTCLCLKSFPVWVSAIFERRYSHRILFEVNYLHKNYRRAIFICHRSEFVTHCFQSRLSQAFNKYGLNWQDYGVMMPQLEQNDYFRLNLLADIYLDNLSLSGGNTTLEAIACHLPVVTCPGEFMRGRHSYAILKKLGITETIATDKNHYIEIAIRLGLDNQWRQTIKDWLFVTLYAKSTYKMPR